MNKAYRPTLRERFRMVIFISHFGIIPFLAGLVVLFAGIFTDFKPGGNIVMVIMGVGLMVFAVFGTRYAIKSEKKEREFTRFTQKMFETLRGNSNPNS